MSEESSYPKEFSNLCNMVGKFIEYWGFKEIEGRIWCFVLLSKNPVSTQQIINGLSISKALASISLTRLLEYNVIRIAYIRDKRTQYYQVNEDVTSVIGNVLRYRERPLLAEINSAAELLVKVSEKESSFLSSTRLDFLKKMINRAQLILDTIIFTRNKIPSLFFGKVPNE